MTLDQLAADPALAQGLSGGDLETLYKAATAVQTTLMLQLVARPVASPSRMLTVEQIAERIARPAAFVRSRLRRGDLVGRRIGKHWAVSEGDLAVWLDMGLAFRYGLVRDTRRASPNPQAPQTHAGPARRAARGPRHHLIEMGSRDAADASAN